jgi:hypothetical protein
MKNEKTCSKLIEPKALRKDKKERVFPACAQLAVDFCDFGARAKNSPQNSRA